MEPKDRIIVALDVDRAEAAETLVRELGLHVGLFKVGLELLMSDAPVRTVNAVHTWGGQVFLDGKFMDIPNTVAGAVRAVTRLGVRMLNVHCLGGSAMMKAAAEAAKETSASLRKPRPLVLGVTILTSLDYDDLLELGLLREADLPTLGVDTDEDDLDAMQLAFAERRQLANVAAGLAFCAKRCGLDGVIASPHEIAEIRERCGRDFTIVTPGVRPTWAAVQDQKRVMTPGEAIKAGADYLVIGRPITKPPKDIGTPEDAAKKITEEIAMALTTKM